MYHHHHHHGNKFQSIYFDNFPWVPAVCTGGITILVIPSVQLENNLDSIKLVTRRVVGLNIHLYHKLVGLFNLTQITRCWGKQSNKIDLFEYICCGE